MTRKVWTLLLGPAMLAFSAGGATFSRGPFLQNATTNSIQISWKTFARASSFVEYGLTDSLGLVVTNAALDTNHLETLLNLQPDTTYYYRAGSEDSAGRIESEIISFRTLKSSGAICFQVVGDSPGLNGVASPQAFAVAAAMRREPTDLVLHVGDLTYSGIGGLDGEFFPVFQPQMKTVPYYLVMGNHDLSVSDPTGVAFREVFSLPTNSATSTEQFYSFDHGDVHFVGLFNPWFQIYVFTSSTIQYTWLINDLAASSKPWKVIFMHFPVATSATHSWDDYNYNGIPDHREVMQLLAPVAEQYGVQIIFACHDHDYERFVPTNGFHSVVTGGGGKAPLYNMANQHPASAQFWQEFEFLRVTVSNEIMLVEAVNTNSVVFDSFMICRTAPVPRLWQGAWNTPNIETDAANDGDGNILGQWFDFIGEPIPAVAGRFSNLGRIYVNNDTSNLYIGFEEASFYRGDNIFLFIESAHLPGVSNMAGLGNGIIDPAGEGVDGLDVLENLSFANFLPSIGCLLGDEYADGQYRSFTRSNLLLNIGQGAYYLDGPFTDMPGLRLQQYNRSPQTNGSLSTTGVTTEQNADYIELSIPFTALGNVQPGEIIKIGAVVGRTQFSAGAQTRELDGGFLGISLGGSNQEPVILEGLAVRLAGDPANPDWDGDGLSNAWEIACGLDAYSAEGDNGASGDPDHDGMTNTEEQSAGTHPREAASRLFAQLHASGPGQATLTWCAVIGKRYQIQVSEDSLTNFVDLADPNLPRTATSTQESYNISWPLPGSQQGAYYRVRLVP